MKLVRCVAIIFLFLSVLVVVGGSSEHGLPNLNSSKIEYRLLSEIVKNPDDRFDVIVYFKNLTIAQKNVDVGEITSLSNSDNVLYIRKPRPAIPSDIQSNKEFFSEIKELHKLGLTGKGVDVAIIDLGFKGYDKVVGKNVVEVKTFRSDGELFSTIHGTYCAEIIAEIAPDVRLHLYAVQTEVEFVKAIKYALGKGADVISVSIGWIADPFDGTGFISKAVDEVVESGAIVVVAAGNYGNRHYEGTFSDQDLDGWHNFQGYDEILNLREIKSGEEIYVALSWDDWPFSDNDYDLYLLYLSERGWEVVASSETVQNGYQEPVEVIDYIANRSGIYGLSIFKKKGAEQMHLELYSNVEFSEYVVPESSLSTPADAKKAIAVGAVDENFVVKDYSSRGPTNDGRIKPDFVMIDEVLLSNGFLFYGTSASAPQVAGLIAILLSARPNMDYESIVSVLANSSFDVTEIGRDNESGYGYIRPIDAVKKAYGGLLPKLNLIVVKNGNYSYVYSIIEAAELRSVLYSVTFDRDVDILEYSINPNFDIRFYKKDGNTITTLVGNRNPVSDSVISLSKMVVLSKEFNVTIDSAWYNGNSYVPIRNVYYINWNSSNDLSNFDIDGEKRISEVEFHVIKDIMYADKNISDIELLSIIRLWLDDLISDKNLLDIIVLWLNQ